jgi:hypothetical protein
MFAVPGDGPTQLRLPAVGNLTQRPRMSPAFRRASQASASIFVFGEARSFCLSFTAASAALHEIRKPGIRVGARARARAHNIGFAPSVRQPAID